MRHRRRSSDWNGFDTFIVIVFLVTVMTAIFVDDIKVGTIPINFGTVLTAYGVISLLRRRFLKFPRVYEDGAAMLLSVVVIGIGAFFISG